MMKPIFILILSICSSVSLAQSVQQGKVMCYQGTAPKTALPNVTIAATNAPVVTSDAEGAFSLSFRSLHAGDAIQFKRVELSGYEVMNKEALEAARVAKSNADLNPNPNLLRPQDARTEGSNPNANTFTIVMVRREVLRQLRDGYRSVAAQRYQKQLKATEAQLEQMRKEGQIAEAQYNARMDSIEADYEEKLSKLETYIDKFARIDLSDLDADEQKIIALVQSGDFDEALKIYDSQNLAERLKRSREEQSKLVAARDQLADAALQKQRENDRLRASIDRQVTLLMMSGDEGCYRKILNIRREVFLADTNHVQARREYFYSLNTIGEFSTALAIAEQGASSAADDFTKGMFEVDIAHSYNATGDLENELLHASRADSLLWPLRDSHHWVTTRYLPSVTTMYLHAMPSLGREEELYAKVNRLREHWNLDETDWSSVTDYMMVLPDLMEYDSDRMDHEQSLWDAREAIKEHELFKKNAQYEDLRFQLHASACHIFSFEGRFDEMKSIARSAKDRLPEVVNHNKSSFNILVLYGSVNTLVEALIMSESYELADSIIAQIEKSGIREIVERKHAGKIAGLQAALQLNMSYADIARGDLLKGEKCVNDALLLMESDEDYASALLFMRPSSMAMLSAAKGNHKEAIRLYEEAIKGVMECCEGEPEGWDMDNICHYYLGIADAYLQLEDIKQSERYLKWAKQYAVFELDKQLIEKRNKYIYKR